MTDKVQFGGQAVIPVGSYANIQPSFTVEGDTFEDARDLWLAEVSKIFSAANKDIDLSFSLAPVRVSAGVDLTCWASGTVVNFDPVQHVYSPGKWLSGSAFASQFTPDFPAALIAGKMAAKYGVSAEQILSMWALNAEASSTFGTSVHAALQLHGEYLSLSQAVKGSNESALTKNPVLRPIVESFFAGREDEHAVYEAFVADPVLRHCGQIDRLLIEDDGLVIEDFKTNTDLTKAEAISKPFKGVVEPTKLGAYWLQLSFYGEIIRRHGHKVKGLRIHHWTGSDWVTYDHDVVDISGAI